MRLKLILELTYNINVDNYGTKDIDEICTIEKVGYLENPFSIFDKYFNGYTDLNIEVFEEKFEIKDEDTKEERGNNGTITPEIPENVD